MHRVDISQTHDRSSIIRTRGARVSCAVKHDTLIPNVSPRTRANETCALCMQVIFDGKQSNEYFGQRFELDKMHVTVMNAKRVHEHYAHNRYVHGKCEVQRNFKQHNAHRAHKTNSCGVQLMAEAAISQHYTRCV